MKLTYRRPHRDGLTVLPSAAARFAAILRSCSKVTRTTVDEFIERRKQAYKIRKADPLSAWVNTLADTLDQKLDPHQSQVERRMWL